MKTVHTGVFTYQPNNYEWINGREISKPQWSDDQEFLIDKDS